MLMGANAQDSVVSDTQSLKGGTMIETNDTERKSEVNSATLRPKKQLHRFYDAVLDKQNQNFLYRLVKQSCMLQKDDKGKESNQGATERTQMVTLALRTL